MAVAPGRARAWVSEADEFVGTIAQHQRAVGFGQGGLAGQRVACSCRVRSAG